MTPGTLRELLRHLQHWEGLFEDEGIYSLTAPDGEVYCLQDLQQLYAMRYQLPYEQMMAVELMLYHDMPEAHAAVIFPDGITIGLEFTLAEGIRTLCEIYNGIYGTGPEEAGISFLDAADTGNFIDLGTGYDCASEDYAPAEWDLPGAGGYQYPHDRAAAPGDGAVPVL